MILDLQKRLVEVGRIRMGATVNAGGGKTRPSKLENWRLTSRDLPRLQAAATIYGGDPQPWDRQDGAYVLDTDTDNLRIMLLPGHTLTQFFEMWSGGGCVRRCDGREEMISGEPCLCPQEYTDRAEQAKEGNACKPTTRLSVLLPDVAGVGCWRLETHGYYAAVELAGTAGLLEATTRGGVLLPARLRIDQRSQLKAGKTTRYAVPVIDIDVRPDEMFALANGAGEGEVIRFKPVPAGARPHISGRDADDMTGFSTVEAGLQAAAALSAPALPRGNAAEPIGPPAPLPPTGDVPVEDDKPAPIPAPPTINHAQLKLLWATIRGLNLAESHVRRILQEHTGQQSTKAIRPDQFEAVLNAVTDTAPDIRPQSLNAETAEADVQPMIDDGTLVEPS